MTKNQLYILKVALSHDKRTWRRIEILGGQSLDQLHETIFQAFDRFDQHMYSFYLTKPGSKARNRFSEAPEYTHPFVVEDASVWVDKKPHDASKTKISSLNLQVKGKFEYLFDFGDEWLHEITVEEILDLYPKGEYPRITEKKGESPLQYQDDEDDEDEHEDFEEECYKIRKINEKVLLQFNNYLASKKLSPKTIEKHIANIEFYINYYLLYEEPLQPPEGVKHINDFLGSWFIRKAMWASVTSVKEYIACFKHFYTFLHAIGQITAEDLTEMKKEIKECKSEWMETVKRYDDPDIDLEDVW